MFHLVYYLNSTKVQNHDFIKPDILEITSVEVYQNNELEDKRIKDALLKAEKERDAIIKEEEDRKLKAYNEIKRLKKQNQKKVVSTMSVHKSLDKLLSNLNQQKIKTTTPTRYF